VAEALGKKLYAVRFDTPSSRRGDFYRILEEARWELNMRGHEHVKFYVSGGIKEQDLPVLNPVADGYGIGTSISNAPVVDFAMDIVEVEDRALAKRGKWSGSKRVLECPKCRKRQIVPLNSDISLCACGVSFRDILVPVLDHGAQLVEFGTPAEIRRRVLENVKDIPLE
jgi:nicotinate phosphoribosyltransferase